MRISKFLTNTFTILVFLTLLAFSHNPKYVTSSNKYHIVRKGETLYSISQKYDTSVEELKRINELESNKILVGQKIYLSDRNHSTKYYVTKRDIPEKGYHVVEKGETLYRISKIYNLTVPELMQYNQLSSYTIKPGQKIWLRSSAQKYTKNISQKPSEKKKSPSTNKPKTEPSNKSSDYHIVKKGETLYSIATQYDMTIYELKHLNNLSSNTIFSGQKLHLKTQKDDTKVVKKQAVESLNIIWPCKGSITSKFGDRDGKPHKGIDISGPVGTPIKAIADGEVVYSKWQRGYGHVMILKHEHGLMSVYAHNKENFFGKGDVVSQGDKIAAMGSSGNSSGPHLHFEIRLEGRAKDPLKYLP